MVANMLGTEATPIFISISSIVWGVIMLLTACVGFKGLKWLNYIAVPLLVIVCLYGLIAGIVTNDGGSAITNYAPENSSGMVFGISMVVASFALGGVISADYCRFAKSRSDVNILAVVNPKTRQILLVNTPRDYYLPLAFNGELDKLTHAGMYGVQESMAVLDNLYGTKTSYYGRINFWGLIDIVDALGGIDVYSDFAFTTDAGDVRGYGYNEYSYTEGWNHMNGIEALTFSRERYSFSDGDNQRGKNQMKVIQAIIEKATSPSVLANYQDLLKAVSDNFITNISYDQISSLVQMMQKNGASWNIQTMSATQGSGDTMQPCYSAYGELLYVMPPDYDSVNRIREVIDQVMNGEEIVLPAE